MAAWALGKRMIVAGIRMALEFFLFPRMHTNGHGMMGVASLVVANERN